MSKMQCRGSVFYLRFLNYFSFLFFLPVQKHFFLRGKSSRDTQIFPSSEIESDFASIYSKDE